MSGTVSSYINLYFMLKEKYNGKLKVENGLIESAHIFELDDWISFIFMENNLNETQLGFARSVIQQMEKDKKMF